MNKQKLIKKWESAIEAAEFYGRGKEDRLIEYMRNFVDDLNQLDEPEVLSQKWIDEHKETIFNLDEDFETEFIKVEDLQNLLVPKQELPVIPKFVADKIECAKNNEISLGIVFHSALNRGFKNRLNDWIRDNQELYAKAWLDGYTVEEEPQYRLKAGENYLYFNLDGTVRGATKKNAVISKRRLKQLPFDIEKAVESGIIEVEELEE